MYITTGLYVSPDAVEKAFGLQPERTIDPSKPMVCLTFDDGPYSPVTDSILDILETYNSKATFFCGRKYDMAVPSDLEKSSGAWYGTGKPYILSSSSSKMFVGSGG